LAKWRDTFTSLESRVKEEAKAKPNKTEMTVGCMEFEIKGKERMSTREF
jgi:hypothetical protein